MPNYANGKVYKIENKNGSHDMVYIGSTTETLDFRLYMHEHQYRHYLKPKSKSSCITAYQVIATEDYKITLLEDYPCASKKELEKREGYYQGQIKCVNKNKAGGDEERKKERNKIAFKKYSKTDKFKIIVRRYQQTDKCKQYFRDYQRRNYQWKKIRFEFLNILL